MDFNKINQIGIVGGGTSALMLCLEAAKKGIQTTLLDPQINCVGSQAATEHMIAPITNENIQKLSLRCDVIVFNTKLDYQLKAKLHAQTYPSRELMNTLSDPKEVLDLLEELNIPFVKTYYQDNKEEVFNTGEAFSQVEKLEFPFRFMKKYKDRVESIDIFTQEDLADFILEIDEKADSFMIQPINTYSSIIVCPCIVDQKGNGILYEPIEEVYEENQLSTIQMPASLSKTMNQKLASYNKKLLKALGMRGLVTIKYGLKPNKAVEIIEITPAMPESAILTVHACDLSIYEQYMHVLLDVKAIPPTLLMSMTGSTTKPSIEALEEAYHIYRLGTHALWVMALGYDE